MRILKHYLKDRLRLLLAILVLFGVAAFVFFLYSLPLRPVLYTAAVTGVLLFLFFVIPDFAVYYRKILFLRELKNGITTSLELPEHSGSYPETELMDISRSLCEKIRQLEEAHGRKQEETIGYYTLWVHQVKTPIAAMRLILQSEETGAGEALKQELYKIERYVDMVLGYLRLETITSDLRLEHCKVHDIMRQAVKKFAPQFIYQKLALELKDFQNIVITDEKWLLFVLEQLLSNAVKYTRRGTVTIEMNEYDVLIIRDTGVGISKDDLPRIFERGFTGYNGRMDKTSSGLGLYLVKRVLGKLHNRIEIDSRPGKGTEVRLYLHRTDFAKD